MRYPYQIALSYATENEELPGVEGGILNTGRRIYCGVEDGIELDRVYGGDTVIWTGKMTFAEGYEGQVDLWANVITESGIEGWSRMYYLRPENYEGVEFRMAE